MDHFTEFGIDITGSATWALIVLHLRCLLNPPAQTLARLEPKLSTNPADWNRTVSTGADAAR